MEGWDLWLCHYSKPEVDSELLRLLDLGQLGLVVAFESECACFFQDNHHLSSFTVGTILGAYSWYTIFSIKAIVSLLGIALTLRAEKPLMTSSSASMKVSCADKKNKCLYEQEMHRSNYTKLKIRKKFWKSPYFRTIFFLIFFFFSWVLPPKNWNTYWSSEHSSCIPVKKKKN